MFALGPALGEGSFHKACVRLVPRRSVREHSADCFGEVAALAEVLRQRGGARAAGAEALAFVENADGVGPQAGEHGLSRRTVGGDLAVVAEKREAALGQCVDVRRHGLGVAVAPEHRAQIVDEQQEDVLAHGLVAPLREGVRRRDRAEARPQESSARDALHPLSA